MTTENNLYLLAINLTRRCNLRCAHCYLDASTLQHGNSDELSTDEVKQLLNEVAQQYPETMVVLTGGEPLLRKDLETLIRYGRQQKLFMVVGTNGVLLNEKRIKSLKTAGVMGLGISLDSLDAQYHDDFRSCPGAWQKTLAGMDLCKRYDIPLQIHFSVTEDNASEVPAMIEFAHVYGARVLNFFFLVCTGRGEQMTDISAASYEKVLHQILQAQEQSNRLIIRARCAPHFQRIVQQNNATSVMTRVDGYDGSSCIAGSHYCRVTAEGDITACPYINKSVGNLRQQAFLDIWKQNPVFAQLRNPQLQGKCGECEYQQLCGGCRARALAVEGNLMAADNWCAYQPQGGAIIPRFVESASHIRWSDGAQQRLSRIPAFLRKMVKHRAEAYVQQLGEREVTTDHLHTMRKQRFGDNAPPADIVAFPPSDERDPKT
jgi:radical SAM protein with 4Fe4S-binding SPASM domain